MNIIDAIKKSGGLVHRLASLRDNPYQASSILFAKIKLLWKCNLSCMFCNAYKRHGIGKIMPLESAREIVEVLKGQGLQKVHFSGGEVFLHPNIMEILDFSCRLGLQVNLTSNGTLIGRETARAIAGMGVHSVSISLDSSSPSLHDRLRRKKGAFKAAVKGVKYLIKYRKKNPGIRINTVVTRDNIDGLGGMHDLLKSFDGAVKWKLIPVDTLKKRLLPDESQFMELFRRAPEWDLLEEIPGRSRSGSLRSFAKGRYAAGYYKSHICYMPWLHLFVDPEGEAHTCCMGRSSLPPLGRLAGGSLDKVLESDGFKAIRGRMARGKVFDICHSCDDFIGENRSVDKMLKKSDGRREK